MNGIVIMMIMIKQNNEWMSIKLLVIDRTRYLCNPQENWKVF